MSFFECRSRFEVELVAVALSATRSFTSHFDYIEIEDEMLETCSIVASPGATPLPDANLLHRDVDLSEGRAGHLVTRLSLAGFEVSRIREPSLRTIAARLASDGHPIPASSWLLDEG